MFYFLTDLYTVWEPLWVLRYLTLRAGGAAVTAFLITVLAGGWTSRKLREFRATAPNRYSGGLIPEELVSKEKEKTPSMGGLLIVFAVLTANILWARLDTAVSWILSGGMLMFAMVGFADDFAKVAYRRRDGIPGKLKLAGQFCISAGCVWALSALPEYRGLMDEFFVPFLKTPVLVHPWIVPLISIIAVTGASNAVNLTDGKDGLAVGCSIFCTLAYAVFAYLCGNSIYSAYLHIAYIPGCGETVIFAAALIGGCIGFLWHNCYPASMFMGDTGSLAIGGVIGLLAVMVRQEVLLILVGGVFVMEALSVMLQVASFKLTGRRIFLCAPIHHHFERKGWTETQIVVRFWILSGLFALMALGTLKIR